MIIIRSNFSSFPQYFQYTSNSRSQITYLFVKCGCLIYFFLNSANLVVEVRIFRSISESSLDRDNGSRLYFTFRCFVACVLSVMVCFLLVSLVTRLCDCGWFNPFMSEYFQ